MLESRFIEEGNELLWHTLIPIDYDRLWDFRGLNFFIKILDRNNDLCVEFVKSQKFREFIETIKVDLAIVDHFIQV